MPKINLKKFNTFDKTFIKVKIHLYVTVSATFLCCYIWYIHYSVTYN